MNPWPGRGFRQSCSSSRVHKSISPNHPTTTHATTIAYGLRYTCSVRRHGAVARVCSALAAPAEHQATSFHLRLSQAAGMSPSRTSYNTLISETSRLNIEPTECIRKAVQPSGHEDSCPFHAAACKNALDRSNNTESPLRRLSAWSASNRAEI